MNFQLGCVIFFSNDMSADLEKIIHLDDLSQDHTETQLQSISFTLKQIMSFMGSSKTSLHGCLRTNYA